MHLAYELGWVFSFTIAILGPSFLKSRRLALGIILNEFAKDENEFTKIMHAYVDIDETGRRPSYVGIVSGLVFFAFRIFVTWDFIPYAYDMTKWFAAVIGSVGFGFFLRSLWLFMAFGYMISQMSVKLEEFQDRLFSWELLEKAGLGYARTSLGAAVFSICVFWLVISKPLFLDSMSTKLLSQIPFLVEMLCLSVIIPILYLMVPQWRLHRILTKRKKEISDLFYSELRLTEKEFLMKPQRELAAKYLLERQMSREIDNLPEWPFRFESLAQIVTLVAIPVFLFVFKEIAVEVLVELLKR